MMWFKKEAKIITYTNLVHKHGVDSKPVRDFLNKNKNDEKLIKRAGTFNELFKLRSKLDV